MIFSCDGGQGRFGGHELPMGKEEEIDDAIWEAVKALLPPARTRRSKYPGRLPQDPRSALGGILFVLRHNLAWNKLPRTPGSGCGSACRKRLAEWPTAGVWERLHAVLWARPHAANQIDRSRAAADASSLRALKKGGELTGPNPTDRARAGSKHHRLTDAGGIPLAALTGAASPSTRPVEASRFSTKTGSRSPTTSMKNGRAPATTAVASRNASKKVPRNSSKNIRSRSAPAGASASRFMAVSC